MRITLTVRHMKNNAAIQGCFDEHVDKLLSRLSNFDESAIFIHANIDKNPHKDHYSCSLTVHLPSMTLHSRYASFDVIKTINASFGLIIRQAEKFKARLRRNYKQKDRKAGSEGNFIDN